MERLNEAVSVAIPFIIVNFIGQSCAQDSFIHEKNSIQCREGLRLFMIEGCALCGWIFAAGCAIILSQY